MKNVLVLILSLGFSVSAFAGNGIERYVGIDFEKAQDLSQRAKEKLQNEINRRCQPSASTASMLSAKLIETKKVRVDQGIIDVTYTVDVKFHGFEQYDYDLATVVMTDYAGQNPSVDWVQIEGIRTLPDGLCK